MGEMGAIGKCLSCCLHGIGSNAQSFAPLMQAFAGEHPTLAWDAPGYGEFAAAGQRVA